MTTLDVRKFLISAGVLVGASTLAFTPQALAQQEEAEPDLSLIHISEPTRL